MITTNGQIRRIADISATQGHIVPTSVAYHGNFYVGNLDTFPIMPGASKILKITPSGRVTEIATGLFLPTGITFGPDGNLYVSNVGFGPPPIGLGQVVKITLPAEK